MSKADGNKDSRDTCRTDSVVNSTVNQEGRQRFYLPGLLVLWALSARLHAGVGLELQAKQLSNQGWNLQGLQLEVGTLGHRQQSLRAQVRQLNLPAPLQAVSLSDLSCPELQIAPERLRCQQGRAHLQMPSGSALAVRFAFTLMREQLNLQISSLTAPAHTEQLSLNWQLTDAAPWALRIQAQQLNLSFVNHLFSTPLVQLEGRLDLDADLSGFGDRLDTLNLRMQLDDLSLSSEDGSLASEGLSAVTQAQATALTSGDWAVSSKLSVQKGALYVQPLYLEAGQQPLSLSTRLLWQPATQQLHIVYADFRHPKVARLQGHAQLNLGMNEPRFVHLAVYLAQAQLQTLFQSYGVPFIAASAFTDLQLDGQASGQIELDNDQVSRLSVQFERLNLNDPQGRFQIQSGQGYLDWRRDTVMRSSRVLWQTAKLYALPLGATDLRIRHNLNRLALAENSLIPILDGGLRIQELTMSDLQQLHSSLHVAAELLPISLEPLSAALDWPPLTGRLSGEIPGIVYQNGAARIEGQLRAHLFGGDITIERLKIAGLLSALPRMTADLRLNRLNMMQLTRRFGFGSIEGLLEGRVRRLYLENWQPVSFDAWLGTPKDDDTPHRISQKAVENITSLGGGGATDALSRSILRFFDSFRYERIGIGCKMRSGTCQMRGAGGVEPRGYYMVKGSGLPRIDIIGYNQRINWQELLLRLQRISTADEAVVE